MRTGAVRWTVYGLGCVSYHTLYEPDDDCTRPRATRILLALKYSGDDDGRRLHSQGCSSIHGCTFGDESGGVKGNLKVTKLRSGPCVIGLSDCSSGLYILVFPGFNSKNPGTETVLMHPLPQDAPYIRRNYMTYHDPTVTTQTTNRGTSFQVMKWRPSHCPPAFDRHPRSNNVLDVGPSTPQSPIAPSPENHQPVSISREALRTDPASKNSAQISRISHTSHNDPATPISSGSTPTTARTSAQISARSQYPGKKLSHQEEITLIRACCDLEDIYGQGGSGWINKFWLEVSKRFKALCGRVYAAASCQRKMTQFIKRRRGEIAEWHAAHGSDAELPTPDEWQVFMDRFMVSVIEYETAIEGRPQPGRKRKRDSGLLDDEDVMREADDLLTNHDHPLEDHLPAETIAPSPRPMPTAEDQFEDIYREADFMREVVSRLRRPNPKAMDNARLAGIEQTLSTQAAQMAQMERVFALRLSNLEMRFARVETELDRRFSRIEELLLSRDHQPPPESSTSGNEEQESRLQTVDQT